MASGGWLVFYNHVAAMRILDGSELMANCQRFLFTAFIASGFLVSCTHLGNIAPSNTLVIPHTPILTMETAQRVKPTHTNEPTGAVQVTPTPAPSATSLPTTTPTENPTPTVTWTPLPTLPPEESRERVSDLFLNNAGCRLPCWWGMTPGQTDWNTARQFLETFVIEIKQRGDDGEEQGSPTSRAGYTIYYESESGEKPNFYVYVENGTINEILTGGLGTQTSFRLNQLLASYGPPDEVFIKTYPDTSSGAPPPFGFILYYGQSHFWAQFDMDGEVVGGLVKACPQSVNPRIWLGSPAREWTLEDLFHYVFGPPVPGGPDYPPLTLLEATGMDLGTFTNTFKDPDNTACIETPAELWH
jgi:hypothetical protein